MGSKRRNSSRPSKAGVSPSTERQTIPTATRPGRPPTDFDALLCRFSDAMSVLATATRSLSRAQEDLPSTPEHDIGEEIVTLEAGVSALRAAYNDLDVAIRELRS